MNKWDLIKLKSFCTTKETIKKWKKKKTHRKGEDLCKRCNWQEPTLQNIQIAHTTQQQKTKQPNWKMDSRLNRHFSQEDIWLGIKYMKKSSIPLLEKCKSELKLRYHLTLVRWPSLTSWQITNDGDGVEKRETLLHCWRECKLVQPLRKTAWRLSQKNKYRTTIWSRNPTPGHISRTKHLFKKIHAPLCS